MTRLKNFETSVWLENNEFSGTFMMRHMCVYLLLCFQQEPKLSAVYIWS